MDPIIISDENFENTSQGYLSLPFSDNQFKTFIVGLLGKPQTITRCLFGKFELYLKDFQNFNELLQQRINQQNNARLIQFKSTIYFSDNSSIVLGSYDELTTYNEIRPVTTCAIQLSWVYLIQFKDKEVPEKQEIDIIITTQIYKNATLDQTMDVLKQPYYNNSITYSISHTARSWGFDIDKLLSDHFETIIFKPTPFISWVRKFDNAIGTIFGLLMATGFLLGMLFSSKNSEKQSLELIKNTYDLNGKLNHIITEITSTNSSSIKFVIFLLGAMLISMLFTVFVTKLCNIYPNSYIILTRVDQTSLAKNKRKENTYYLKLLGTLIAAISLELVANYIYDHFIKL